MNQFARETLEEIIAKHAKDLRPRSPSKLPGPPAFAWYAANADALAPIVLDQSPRARMLRKIRDLAFRYPWGPRLVQRAMDSARVECETDLPEPAMIELLAEVERQHDRAMFACDDDDAPPAR